MKIGGRSPPFPDTELIRALAALLTETGLTEIEYALGDRRIRVARAAGGPMHTVSSASRTCIAVVSAVEWTATVLIPISRQAR